MSHVEGIRAGAGVVGGSETAVAPSGRPEMRHIHARMAQRIRHHIKRHQRMAQIRLGIRPPAAHFLVGIFLISLQVFMAAFVIETVVQMSFER